MFLEEVITIPFSTEQLQDKFSGKYDEYVIDYEKSNIKNVGFLSYIRNANINAVVLNPSIDLMVDCVKSINVLPKSNLTMIHCDLLLLKATQKQYVLTGCIFDFFSECDVDLLLDKLDEVLLLQIKLITSLPLYIICHTQPSTPKDIPNLISGDVLMDSGRSWVTVATQPDFMSILIQASNVDVKDMCYYSCLDEYAFNGLNLFGTIGSLRDHSIPLLFNNFDYIVGNNGHTENT